MIFVVKACLFHVLLVTFVSIEAVSLRAGSFTASSTGARTPPTFPDSYTVCSKIFLWKTISCVFCGFYGSPAHIPEMSPASHPPHSITKIYRCNLTCMVHHACFVCVVGDEFACMLPVSRLFRLISHFSHCGLVVSTYDTASFSESSNCGCVQASAHIAQLVICWTCTNYYRVPLCVWKLAWCILISLEKSCLGKSSLSGFSFVLCLFPV